MNDSASPWFPPHDMPWNQPYSQWHLGFPTGRYPREFMEDVVPAMRFLKSSNRLRKLKWGFESGGSSILLSVSGQPQKRVDSLLREALTPAIEAGRVRPLASPPCTPETNKKVLSRYQGMVGVAVFKDFREIGTRFVIELFSAAGSSAPGPAQSLVDIAFLCDVFGLSQAEFMHGLCAWLARLRIITEPVGVRRYRGAALKRRAAELTSDASLRRLLAALRAGLWREAAGAERVLYERYETPLRALGKRLRRLSSDRWFGARVFHSYVHSHILRKGIDNEMEKLLYSVLAGPDRLSTRAG